MKAQIQKRAADLEFDLCAVTTTAPPDRARRFQQWLELNHHGEMGYLQRTLEKRSNPQLVLPGARSVIVLGVSYHDAHPQTGGLPAKPTGIVARYARFTDYHEVMGQRLRKLCETIGELGGPDCRSLWYTDTGPVLEREFAERAGIGFVGKHTNLISRRLGNWLFLGEILTTLDLEPDQPEKNRCGSCTRCLTACPTNAFTAPFQLDARRCISYLTIELKGSIPVEFRKAIGNRILGCDDCLAACPWNRFAKEGAMMRSHARSDLHTPDLLELLSLDAPTFKQRFRGTPIERTKRRGLLRNVAVALGNTADRSALPTLAKAGEDPEPLIAEHAAWAIQQIEQRTQV